MILFDQATKDFKALMRKISGIIQLISRRMRDKNIKSPSPEYLRKKFEDSVPHLPLRILILPGLISHGTAESHDADTLLIINFIVNADASVRWDPFIFVIMISMYIQNGSRSKRCKKGKIPRIQIPAGNDQVNSLKLALFEIIPQIL